MAVLSLFLPPVCVACRRLLGPHNRGALCSLCRLEQSPLPAALSRLDGVEALHAFDGPLGLAVGRLKFSGDTALAGPLGKLLSAAPSLAASSWDRVVPVPLHPLRTWARGYNQSILLARWMLHHARRRGLRAPSLAPATLRRTRSTPAQQQLDAAARRHNLVGAFTVHPRVQVTGERILLLDDVTTTGATMSACREALLAVGAAEVGGLALLRTLPD